MSENRRAVAGHVFVELDAAGTPLEKFFELALAGLEWLRPVEVYSPPGTWATFPIRP